MRALLTVFVVSVLGVSVGAQTLSVPLPEGHEFTNPDRQPFSLSSDGTRMTYLARGTLFVTNVGGASMVVQGPLQGRGKANPVFSPDGQSILYWAQDDSAVQHVPAGGGAPVTIATVAMPYGLSWGADGNVLIGQGADGIVRVSAGGGPIERLVEMDPGQGALGPQLLPGGAAVLFTLAEGTPSNWERVQVVVQSLATGERTVIVAGRDGRYLPSGHLAYLDGSSVMAVGFNATTLATVGEPVVLFENVQVNGASGAALFSVAADGTVAAVGAGAAPIELALVGLDGTRTSLGTVPPGTAAPRISADGQRVTFAAAQQIYVAELSNIARAQKIISDGTFPLFSPDGEWLAFGSLNTAREGGEEVLFLQRSDGSGEAELIARPARAPEHWPAGPQGFTFITHRGGANNYDLWAYAADRKEVEPLVVIDKTAQLSSAFSPDGKWLTYMSSESGDWHVYVRPYPTSTGAAYQVTTAGGRSPMWVSSDRLVYDNDGQMFSVRVGLGNTPAFGTPVELPISGYIQPLLRRNWDVMPNGEQLLMLFRPGPVVEVLDDWTVRVPATSARD